MNRIQHPSLGPQAWKWRVLAGGTARWAVRAVINAVLAHAYGLTRDQYAHVLSGCRKITFTIWACATGTLNAA